MPSLRCIFFSRRAKIKQAHWKVQPLSVNQSITLLKQASREVKPFGVCCAFIDWLMFAERTDKRTPCACCKAAIDWLPLNNGHCHNSIDWRTKYRLKWRFRIDQRLTAVTCPGMLSFNWKGKRATLCFLSIRGGRSIRSTRTRR